MTIETWLAFTAASAILLVIPGPTVLLVVSYALGQGWRTALPMAVGRRARRFHRHDAFAPRPRSAACRIGDRLHGAQWLGAAYLVCLGVKLWRAGGTSTRSPAPMPRRPCKMLAMPGSSPRSTRRASPSSWRSCRNSSTRRPPSCRRSRSLAATFLVLAFANAADYALVASRARQVVQQPAGDRHRQQGRAAAC